MTAITVPRSTTDTSTATRVPTWKSGLGTAVIAAAVTTAVAAALRAVGVPLDIDGEAIPIAGFAQMVLLFSVVGVVMARHMRRVTFLRTTVVLTVLSIVPDVFADTGAATKLSLMLTHVVAAAIVIPRLARPLAD
jgi:hypothetical protein